MLKNEYRNRCTDILNNTLSNVLNSNTNINLIEKYIFEYTNSEQEYLYMLYEILGLLYSYDKIKNEDIKNIILNIYNNQNIVWDNRLYDEYKNKQEEEDQFITTPFTLEEGVLECMKCGSKRTFSFQKQTRSCDEGATTIGECGDCGHKWMSHN